jgi:hypothetical protein
LHQIYAFVAGYFWIPCAVCGRMFGGHECGAFLYDTPYTGSGKRICSRHGDACRWQLETPLGQALRTISESIATYRVTPITKPAAVTAAAPSPSRRAEQSDA